MENEITTAQTLPDGGNVASAGGPSADSESVSLSQLLSKELGKQFPDDATALKAVKDTFSYVGKTGKFAPKLEQLQTKLGGENAVLQKMDELLNGAPAADYSKDIAELRSTIGESQFYTENPQYAPYKDVIKSMGADPKAVVEGDVFKATFEKLKLADETQQSKSVIHTNPRLGAVADTMTQAAEAQKAGNSTQAGELATKAVLDAFEPDR